MVLERAFTTKENFLGMPQGGTELAQALIALKAGLEWKVFVLC
jgi:hypothetical protein